ncbi:hypothetical protein PSE_0485 [Pseudovibrio sp. FO-BEG1]|nr:hypothetical protein PSE_0485 [Pseudovibrio sp. FO-BEG1]
MLGMCALCLKLHQIDQLNSKQFCFEEECSPRVNSL